MNSFRFLHTADLHIGSPLRGLEQYPGAPAERIRRASCEAVERLVQIACRQQVRFVVIAGDIFDGKWNDARIGLWLNEQFRRLGDEGIEVFLLRGNHDAAHLVPQRISWPDNVTEFPVEAPGRSVVKGLPVSITGQGFAQRETAVDLAANYPPAESGHFNIGVLHTSLTGRPQHATYAPTSLEVLRRHAYDYWALGHVHAFEVVSTDPHVVFSGTPQGRHAKELGAKGCVLVDVSEGTVSDVSFIETDVVRWVGLQIPTQTSDTLDDVLDATLEQLGALREERAGRLLAVRIEVQGSCDAHRRILEPCGREDASHELRSRAARWNDVWIERVDWQTTVPVDLDELRQSHDLVGDLLRLFAQVQADPEALAGLKPCFESLAGPHARLLREANVDLEDPASLLRWTQQAESLVVSLLCESDNEGSGHE